jgi:peptidoglycan hydrolase CwlO-like protein
MYIGKIFLGLLVSAVIMYVLWLGYVISKGVADIITSYSNKISDMTSMITSNTKDITQMNDRISEVNNKLAKFEDKLTKLEDKIDKFLESQNQLNDRLSYVEGFSKLSRFNRRV